MTDHVFEVGQRVRYTLDTRMSGIPQEGTEGTVTAYKVTETGILYAIHWDGGIPPSAPAWFPSVLEPVE